MFDNKQLCQLARSPPSHNGYKRKTMKYLQEQTELTD